MLGLIKSNQGRSWMWAAYGKHPAIKDYFRVGQDFPLLRVFSGWVETGYKKISKSDGDGMRNVWHFWARGSSGDSIICGLVKDSADGIGRHYPLLVLGAGPLCDWEENWDLLPLACEESWRDIEYLSILDFDDLKKLEAELLNVRHPQPRWREFQSKKEFFPGDSGDGRNESAWTADRKESFIPLMLDFQPDQNLLSSCCCSSYRRRFKVTPNVIFTGESLGRYFIRFYDRPLAPADFVSLWNAGAGDQAV